MIDAFYNFFLNFGFKKLRKSGYKSELSGRELNESNFKIECKYNLTELTVCVNNNAELLFWVLDRVWEDWLVLLHEDDTYKILNLPLGDKEKQIIAKVKENLSTPLGLKTAYINEYDPTLLFPVQRITSRKEMGYQENKDVIFTGFDIWNCYEVSYLNSNGKPQSAMIRFAYDSDSEFIVESKSVKLYLNSFNQTRLDRDIRETIKEDLKKATNCNMIYVDYIGSGIIKEQYIPIHSIDYEHTEISEYTYNSNLLKVEDGSSRKGDVISLTSDLLKSNCRMSGLPDWATFNLFYVVKDKVLNNSSLLEYLISYRNHREFHEPCCEKIITDLVKIAEPEAMRVDLKYTRRGGCDINPTRIYPKQDFTFSYLEAECKGFVREERQ